MKKFSKIWFKWFVFFNIVISLYLLTMYKDNTNVFEKLTERDTTIYIVIHHSASSGSHQLIDYYLYHREKQFNSIAYTFMINKSGVIEQLHSVNEKTDHVSGFNNCAIGICLEGNFNTEKPNIFQQISLIILTNYLCSDLNVRKENIKPHSFFGETDCPGRNFDFDNFLKLIL